MFKEMGWLGWKLYWQLRTRNRGKDNGDEIKSESSREEDGPDWSQIGNVKRT